MARMARMARMRKIGWHLTVVLLIGIFCIFNAEAQELDTVLTGFREFMVSENYGTIRDSHFTGNNKGIIIHIQDLHCNYDAQMSIYHIIDELIDRYSLGLVTVEGSVGRLETAPFSSYPNERTKEEVASYFLKKGDLDGAAFCHIMRKSGFTFWGVDDKNMYKDNVEAFRASIDSADAITKYYSNIGSILQKFKEKVYSKELKELDDKIIAYNEDILGFSEYVFYIEGLLEKQALNKDDYQNFIHLCDVLRKEAEIDFLEVDNERSEYVDKLSDELEKGDLSGLLDKSLYFKMGKIGALEFYAYLEDLSSSKTEITSIKDYEQLSRYVEYIKIYSIIDNILLFEEIEAIESTLKEKLFRNKTERKIDSLCRNLAVLKDLFNLKLTKETLQYYREHRKEFMTSHFLNFITENAKRHGISYRLDPAFRKIDAALPKLEKFYKLAEERDGILVDNTMDMMRKKKANIAVLVSGGFHTQGITTLLKEKDVSYVVITPKVESLQADNPYKSVLLGEETELDRVYDTIMKNKKK